MAGCSAGTYHSDIVLDGSGSNLNDVYPELEIATSIAETLGTEGDDGAAAALGCRNTNLWLGETSDPRSVCAVRCTSATNSGSDVTISIDQVSTPSGPDANPVRFTAHVVQTAPVALDETFTSVGAWWTGDFFNFDGSNSAWTFHLLTDGGRTVSGGELHSVVGVDTNIPFPLNLACVIYRN